MAYRRMMELLDEIAPVEQGANLVVLHGLAYETIRKATELPARLVTMGLSDRPAYRASAQQRIPLDEKLFNVKTATTVAVSTVRGRMTIPFDVVGYSPGWGHRAPAHLIRHDDGGFEIHFGVTPNASGLEDGMTQTATESILSRAGRLIAGIAHESIDRAESKNKLAVVKQAIREIEKAEGEAKTELGRERAQQWRLDARTGEIESALGALNPQIESALASGRDDLARAGVARQIDLEAQLAAIATAKAETRERIAAATTALAATQSALEDAENRLADLEKSEREATSASVKGGDVATGSKAASRAAKGSRTVSRLTGASPATLRSKELDDLSQLHRDREIDQRLARLKSGKDNG